MTWSCLLGEKRRELEGPAEVQSDIVLCVSVSAFNEGQAERERVYVC